MSKQNMSTLTGAKSADKSDFSLIDESFLKSRIYTIRGIKVMVDSDLAEIYGYTTKAFNRQVKNNIEKFEDDFRFHLTKEEYYEVLRCKKCTLESYLAERPSFYQYLEGQNLAVNTMDSYCWTADFFKSHFGRFGRKSLADYKSFLLEKYKPKTVNLRIQGINKYLDFAGKSKLRIKNVKVQQKSFLENVISDADYKFLKTSLLQDGQTKWYFVVWFLSATGARVGELVKLKVEHVECGFFDIYGKGGKLRRLYIPETLQKEALKWLAKDGRSSGYLFLNRFGKQITPRGIASQLKTFAKKYGLDEVVVYPHSFRHRFAKNFLEKRNDIALLADLMGHEHIETTRIYLRQTASEQREVVNKVVTW